MTDKEILQKVIEIAVNNGYKLDQGLLNLCPDSIAEMCSYYKEGYLVADTIDEYETYSYSIAEMIFSHKFAKAFWGEKKLDDWEFTVLGATYDWEANLQQMTLCQEPLKYLAEFLSED